MIKRVAATIVTTALTVLAAPAISLAQSPAPSEPDIWGNMPGALILLVPLALGGAFYLSRFLSGSPDEPAERREGAVSRALARKSNELVKETDADGL